MADIAFLIELHLQILEDLLCCFRTLEADRDYTQHATITPLQNIQQSFADKQRV